MYKPLGTCSLGNKSDLYKKRLRAYFRASLLVLKDTHGLESHALAGAQLAAFERQEWISWNSAKVLSRHVNVFKAQNQSMEPEHASVCCPACDPLEVVSG